MYQFFLGIYLGVVILRPSEVSTFFQKFHLFESASVVMIFVILTNTIKIKNTIDIRMMLYFLIVLVLSNVSVGWIGGSINASIEILRLLIIFFSIVAIVNDGITYTRIVRLLVAFAVFLSINGIYQYFHGSSLGGITPIIDNSKGGVIRVRYSGILNDPNEFGMLLLGIVSYVYVYFLKCKGLFTRSFLLCIAVLLGFCIYLTFSRGAYLGAAFMLLLGIIYSKSRFRTLAFGGIVVLVLLTQFPQFSGLLGSISTSEESAGGRIYAWREGLAMLKYYPILGVGYGRFTEFHSYTAHNSYVLAMAENGFLGLYFFMGYICATVAALHQCLKNVQDIEKKHVTAAIVSILTTLWCMLFLSRTYSPISFVMFGLYTSTLSLMQETYVMKYSYLKIFAASCLIILVIKLVVMFGI